MPPADRSGPPTTADVRAYWDAHIHDLAISAHPPGSTGFFADLDHYHFEKLHHLLRLVPFDGLGGRRVLDLGCGAGIDLVRFARGGARVTGADLSTAAVRLAREHTRQQACRASLLVADGEHLPFRTASFDYVFAHGVAQYTPDSQRLVNEAWRVLKPGGEAVFQFYNRRSWLSALSRISRVDLEHVDAPVLKTLTAGEVRALVSAFPAVRLVFERFPVRSRLHGGWKGLVFNTAFVGLFNALPRRLTEPFGWHLLAFGRK